MSVFTPSGLPKVTFVIATRDEEPEILQATLDGIWRTCVGFWREIIIIDDASRVPIDLVHPEVTILRNEIALGCCPSRRLGCSIAQGDYLCIIDPHMSFRDGWLQALIKASGGGALLCSPWSEYDFSKVIAYGVDFAWDRHHPGVSFRSRKRSPGRVSKVPMIIGACYFIERQSYERLGGFSPFYHIWGYDEQDLSMRAWMAGIEVRCVPDAQVGHLSRDGVKKLHRLPYKGSEFNGYLLLRSVLEETTWQLYRPFFEPLLPEHAERAAALDFDGWRERVQSVRVMSDGEFFRRFLKSFPISPERPSIKRSFVAPGWERAEAEKVLISSATVATKDRTSCQILDCRFHFGLPSDLAADFQKAIPWSAETPNASTAREIRFKVERTAQGFSIFQDGELSVTASDVPTARHALSIALMSYLAENSSHVLFPASVVEHGGQILVLPRRNYDGGANLLNELVRQGSKLLADRYLVFDPQGRLVPFLSGPPKLEDDYQPRFQKAALVALIQLRPGCRWRPKTVPASVVVKTLLENQYLPAQKRQIGIRLMASFLEKAKVLASPRDELGKAAKRLIYRMTRTSL